MNERYTKPGTNYCWRGIEQLSLAHMLQAKLARQARCDRGEHEPVTVPANRVVYAPFGRRLNTGDRYCQWCSKDLPRDEDDQK